VKGFPAYAWLKGYNKDLLIADSIAAIIVTVMLIPQSLGYAMLAGVSPEVGLYASIIPLVAYALLGTSRTLSVGPVAVISLMTAVAVSDAVAQTGADYHEAAIVLALLSGCVLVVMGFLKFGFLANFLSHPVVSGFISASGILIALSQLKHLLGISAHGDTLPSLLLSLSQGMHAINLPTLAIGSFALILLIVCRRYLVRSLIAVGLSENAAGTISKAAPVLAILLTIVATIIFDLESLGVAIVGEVPRGLPTLAFPTIEWPLVKALLPAAILISVIGYVESISVGRTLGAKRRQRVDANQELVGLGAANLASAFSSGFPVTGGFSRSVVNFDAGAQTGAASILTALGIALAALFLTPILYFLPKATLGATIIVAVMSLVDLGLVKKAWNYSRRDALALLGTLVGTLLLGVEAGVIIGVALSVMLHLYHTSKPHTAIVGEVPGTEHFRNVDRHDVITDPKICSIRIDESLYFPNASYLEDLVYGAIAKNPDIKHIVLMCSAVNSIDMSALEALEMINSRLSELGLKLHLSEVKGPIMDALKRTDFLAHLSGSIYLSQHQAFNELRDDH
jgi:sulfate permease, SulP family